MIAVSLSCRTSPCQEIASIWRMKKRECQRKQVVRVKDLNSPCPDVYLISVNCFFVPPLNKWNLRERISTSPAHIVVYFGVFWISKLNWTDQTKLHCVIPPCRYGSARSCSDRDTVYANSFCCNQVSKILFSRLWAYLRCVVHLFDST